VTPQNPIIILAYLALCVLVAHLGRRRKWGYWGYLWASVLFTPLMGILFVLAADPPPSKRRDTASGPGTGASSPPGGRDLHP